MGTPPRPTGTITCTICGTEAERRSWVQTLCGDPTCRRRAKTNWQLDWQKANPEKHGEYTKLTRQRNPDPARARVAIRQGRQRAEKYGVEHVPYTVDQLLALLPAGCALCHEDTGATVGWDHIVPLVKGGADRIENIQPAHDLCNRRKGDSLAA
jgi:5-methylcytosine-specific restriction endonuclease McrA